MSLDIGGFLKAEIARKKNALKQEGATCSSVQQGDSHEEPKKEPKGELPEKQEVQETQQDSHRNLHQNETGPDEGNESSRKKSCESEQGTLQRLQTRPERIKHCIEKDTDIDLTIDPRHITDSEQTSLLCMQCNLYIHELLDQWSKQGYRPELLPETKKSFFPLLVRLRRSTLPRDLITSLATVLYHIQANELHLATESYMKLSIGNVAWPIGVTSVGIHARSAQTRIQGDNGVANIMQDDRTRLWITSVKRLITFKEFFKG